jgi:Na+-transporting methylmalonyl-CoA/oxaloacetate decarboxylase gamma subunit
MNIETFDYSIMSAVLGMAVVFGFLSFLSILMVLLTTFFSGKKKEENKPLVIKGAKESRSSKYGETGWVIAAATTYLFLEEQEHKVSAASWEPNPQDQQDPWIVAPRIQASATGV